MARIDFARLGDMGLPIALNLLKDWAFAPRTIQWIDFIDLVD